MSRYEHTLIEKKWQRVWELEGSFKTREGGAKKCYILDMFPYPSGEGLHVGHLRGYTVTDILARYKRLQGYDVLHPMGWDAFGLPAEQFALKTGKNPRTFTDKNIGNFKRQIKNMGYSYDWDKEVNTTDPRYYEQTQEIFRLLFKHNLAKLEEVAVNWCPGLGTVLANEEILVDSSGKRVSERGGFPVYERWMKQWVLKIVDYADKLLEGLDEVDFSNSIKLLQRNWIGRCLGYSLNFKLLDRQDDLSFDAFLGEGVVGELSEMVVAANLRDRGVRELFVKLGGSLEGLDGESGEVVLECQVQNTELGFKCPLLFSFSDQDTYNSGFFLRQPEGREELSNTHVKADLRGVKQVTRYKMRNWVFSRQRYWGEPFPILYRGSEIKLVDSLVELPESDDIRPTGDGEGPLANIKEWVELGEWKRETNTMPQWAGSSWYYLAYILKNPDGSYERLASPEAMARFKRWLPVDIYVGGQEHATLHLLYARFWHRFLYDIGVVPTREPFIKLINQGMILGSDGQKMSKSVGNVVNPDAIIEEYGADTLRVYEMFMGPIGEVKDWSERELNGIHRWLKRVWQICHRIWTGEVEVDSEYQNLETTILTNQTIKEVTRAVEELKFNVAISRLMVYFNHLGRVARIRCKGEVVRVVVMLSVFAPHICEEMLERLSEKRVEFHRWPTYDERVISDSAEGSLREIAVQVDGRLRAVLHLEDSLAKDRERVKEECLKLERVSKYLTGCRDLKTIFSRDGKVVNFVCTPSEE